MSTPGLVAAGLVKRFGGVTALDGVDLHAPLGTITGLMGPNGAGKSTAFNLCGGLLTPTSGTVVLHGADITRASVSERARRGLGRTFQQTRLFQSMTVRENVELGREASFARWQPFRQLISSAAERAEVRRAADEAIELCGIADLTGRPAASLTTGQRRLVELARTLAGPFDLVLLDEPSAGLDAVETDRFAEVLETVVSERGVGLFLVEHDVELVMRLCSHIYVIDFGRPIFEGPPAAVRSSDAVRAAYLGHPVAS